MRTIPGNPNNPKEMNADIEFRSVDHVLDEIRAMRVKGGSPFGRSAAWAFILAIQQEEINSISELNERIQEISGQLIALKPTMGTIANTIYLVNKQFSLKKDDGLELCKQSILKLCRRIIELSYDAVNKLGVFGGSLVKEDTTVMMHSYSSSLMSCFRNAAEQGKQFRVICTESRPLRESRLAVKMLQGYGIPVTYITDASIWEFIPSADIVIMGADAIAYNGDVANKMGAALVTQLAMLSKVPVYVATEIFKLDLRTRTGYRIQMERRSADEILQDGDFDSLEGIEVINQFFDLTPSYQIAGLITQYGIFGSEMAPQLWERFERDLLVQGESGD